MINYIIKDLYTGKTFSNTNNEFYVVGILKTMIELNVIYHYICYIEINEDNLSSIEITPTDLFQYLVLKNKIDKQLRRKRNENS